MMIEEIKYILSLEMKILFFGISNLYSMEILDFWNKRPLFV